MRGEVRDQKSEVRKEGMSEHDDAVEKSEIPELGHVERTARGFPLVKFSDSRGVWCSVQMSSIVLNYEDALERPGTSALWIGADSAAEKMHLDREQVAGLIERLMQWLETGQFVEF